MSLKSWSFSSSDRRDDGLFSGWGRLAAVMAVFLLTLDNKEEKEKNDFLVFDPVFYPEVPWLEQEHSTG